jgi:SAM-dependent methyltransferase
VLDRAATSVRLRALDLRDRVSGRADRLVPPRRLDFVGPSDFVGTGDEFLTHFIELAGLQPEERVLDVGCGIGRMARPLAGYLASAGSYDGFDINREGISWCRRRYADRPNFRFELADLHNRRYNPQGTQRAEEFRFPYDDATFDLAICTSVLTHLLEAQADHYLAEISRVLAPGGRVLATFFLLDDESRGALREGRAGLAFREAEGPVALVSEEVPEEAVAFDRAWVDDALARHGLAPAVLEPGSWRGGTAAHRSFQDLVVARRA